VTTDVILIVDRACGCVKPARVMCVWTLSVAPVTDELSDELSDKLSDKLSVAPVTDFVSGSHDRQVVLQSGSGCATPIGSLADNTNCL